ncbi:MAG: ABC transporter ATP-binding protein [Pseudomonadota bacterium]
MPSTPASTEPRLCVRGLTVRYGEADAVKEVDLDAHAGEIVAIVGESGAGKTSIGAALLDLVDPPGRWNAERATLDGEPIDFARCHVRGRDISVIFQDPQTALNPLFSVEAQLTQMLRHHERVGERAAKARAVEMLEEVGIADAAARVRQFPHQFSGGMRQRVVIALAIACNPRLVIADEPTSALDVSVRGQVLDLIKRLARERGTAVLLITHDMAAVARIADRVAVMRYGNIVETASTADLMEHPQHPYAQMLIDAVPPGDRTISRFKVPDLAPAAHSGRSPDTWLRAEGRDSDTGAGANSGPVLQLEGVTKRFALSPGLFGRGGRILTAVDDVSFCIGRGEAFGLVGESGSGKSTIAQLVGALHAPDGGTITFAGKTLRKTSKSQALTAYRDGLQMIFQDPFSSLNRRMRVGDIIAEPILTRRTASRGEVGNIVGGLLERVGLPANAMHRYPHAFSGGQRQRIALARALAGRPRLLICDEPTSALDVSIQAQLLNLLMDLKDDLGLSLLFITHDLPVVRQVADRIGVMHRGRLVELAGADALFDTPKDPYTRTLMDELPHRHTHPHPAGAL